MELINRYVTFQNEDVVKKIIIENSKTSNIQKNIAKIRKEICNRTDFIFFNIIPTQKRGVIRIMLKTRTKVCLYEYIEQTEELNSMGTRSIG